MRNKKTKKAIVLVLSLMLLLNGVLFYTGGQPVTQAATFAKGADISWIPGMESLGYKWYNKAGVQKDPLTILKEDFGINAARIRVFVNPSKDAGNGLCDKAATIKLAKRAKALGMSIMIDFHYSDSWADPGQQNKPAAWKSYTFEQLMTAVYNHTLDVMNGLKAEGIYPEWVQVGNETNDGMLWNEGKASVNMKNFAWFINCGYDAVKAVSSSTKVIVHMANGDNNTIYRWLFDGITKNGAKFDVIGMSLYGTTSNWSTLSSQCLTNMKDMVSRYGKEVMLCEIGMSYDQGATAKTFISTMVKNVKSLSNSKGLGVFYWEPCAFPGFNSYNMGAWNSNGKPTVALEGFAG